MQCGKANEFDILSLLNNHCFDSLNPKWRSHLRRMFPQIQETDLVKAYSYHDSYAKPDIVIMVGEKRIFLSIKSGHNPSCHQESFYSFMEFLRKSQVPERYLRTISFYHFGKSRKLSNNGKSFTKEDIVSKYGHYLTETNQYLETRKDLTEKVIYRAVIRGVRSNVDEIDYFYYGNVNNGFLLSRQDIYELITNDLTGTKNGAPRFGSLVYQPNGRKENGKDQAYVRIKWPILCTKYYDKKFMEKYS
jgi:hypothetical protein